MADRATLTAARPVRGNVERAWAQLRHNRAALAGLIVVAVLVVTATFAPFIAPYNPYIVSLDARLQPPVELTSSGRTNLDATFSRG